MIPITFSYISLFLCPTINFSPLLPPPPFPLTPTHPPSLALRSAALGAGYGTAKSGVGIANMAVMHPELIMKSIIPVVMAGIIAIYGLVVSVLIAGGLSKGAQYPLFKGFIDLGAGLSVGISGLAAGYAIGVVGDAGVRGTGQQPKLFVGMILILIFAEVLGKCARCDRSAFECGLKPMILGLRLCEILLVALLFLPTLLYAVC